MTQRHINPPTLARPTGYTHVVETTAARTVYISGQVALVDNRWKLIHVPRAAPSAAGKKRKKEGGAAEPPDEAAAALATQEPSSYMLFDLIADPGETKDLAAAEPEVTSRLAQSLAAWRQSCNDSRGGRDYPRARPE